MEWIIWKLWIHNTDLFFTVHTKDLGSQTGNRKSISFWDIVIGFPQHWFNSAATLWQVGHTRLDNRQWRNAPLCRQTRILVLLRSSSSLPDVRGISRTAFHSKSHMNVFSLSSRSLDLDCHHHSKIFDTSLTVDHSVLSSPSQSSTPTKRKFGLDTVLFWRRLARCCGVNRRT